MANPTMNEEYKNNSQRYAICNSQWERRSKNKADASWEDCCKNGALILL